MPMQREHLYFIAIIVPDVVAAEIDIFKYDIRDNYGSKAALKTVPHITLKAPFKLPAEMHKGLEEWFHNIPHSSSPFHIGLENFGCFDNSYTKVIYVKPQLSAELKQLQANIIDSFSAAYPQIRMSTHEHEFTPHITIAYRDLTPENFEKAWPIYKDSQYASSFTCRSFCLLKHNGIKWEVVNEKLLTLD